jgi:hypothetical protein
MSGSPATRKSRAARPSKSKFEGYSCKLRSLRASQHVDDDAIEIFPEGFAEGKDDYYNYGTATTSLIPSHSSVWTRSLTPPCTRWHCIASMGPPWRRARLRGGAQAPLKYFRRKWDMYGGSRVMGFNDKHYADPAEGFGRFCQVKKDYQDLVRYLGDRGTPPPGRGACVPRWTK